MKNAQFFPVNSMENVEKQNKQIYVRFLFFESGYIKDVGNLQV